MNRVPLIRVVALLGLSSFFMSCGSLIELPNSGPAPALYNLTPGSPQAQAGDTTKDARILIEDMTSVSGLDQTLIARRPSPIELQYFAGGRWSERPTEMLQNMLAETFEAAGQATSRAEGGSPLPSGYEIQVELRDFQAEYFGSATVPEVHVRLAITLVRLGPPSPAGQHIVDVKRQASGPTLVAVVDAFNEATRDALAETVDWSLETLN